MQASTTTTTGTSNAAPKAMNIDITKLKYASMSGAAVMLLGVKPGDVMIKVGTKVVKSPAQLLAAVSSLKPLTATTVQVQRGAKQIELSLTVAQRPRPQAEPD